MRLEEDSSVCSILRLKGFGETIPGGDTPESGYDSGSPVAKTFPEFVTALERSIAAYDKTINEQSKHASWRILRLFDRMAMVTAVVLSTQPRALKFLRKLGFTGPEPTPYRKYTHRLTILTMPIPDLLDRIQELKGNPPATKMADIIIQEHKDAEAAGKYDIVE